MAFDLDAIFQRAFGRTTHVVAVDGIMTQGNNIYLDDFTFASGALRRTYQVVPGAAVVGVLGGAAGPNVADAGVRRYYHYNDLGTVLLQTRLDAAGTFGVEGAWEPDFFGNYEGRAAYPGSPTRPELGLTGQFFDTATGTYHFRYRELDPERGRWLSNEPLGLDGPNFYHFGYGNVANGFDYSGLGWIDWLHSGLDAAGLVDPTPFSDGVNGLIYVGQGEWGNAGISFVAIVPYIGDLGKAGKYGAKGIKAASEGAETLREIHAVEKIAVEECEIGIKAETKGGTYIHVDAEGNVMRSGRTNDLARREAEHLRDPDLADYQFQAVHHTDSYEELRGLEKWLDDTHHPPLNKIRPVSPSNPNLLIYDEAARRFLSRGE